ncbi:DNA cytosine methyltransferase [Haemophilus haemolyticus]|jgi:DNA (cytosine-5-)-methyltransferase|uniref:DNA cytosine methyltransferase n=1 Tax=Haemophilus haemolyticus TaxID=726 RepID=UPI000E0D2937|nr:DNA cytosine methyltransferase [Haemophilus haemolyticus]
MLNTIDLFAGCGGLTEGFKQSRAYSLLAAIEWEKAPLLSLRNRLEKKWRYSDIENKVIHFDIQRTDELFYGFSDDVYGESIGLDKLIGDSSVDIIIGGPPCQAYSIAGRIRDKNGMRDDYRNYLFESYLKVVDHFQPKACIFENVLGMLSATPGGISIIDRISKSFESIGYVISKNIKEQAVFDMSEFGIPQKRKRVILVAFNKNKIADSEILIDKFYFNLNKMKSGIKTVNDAIGDMPPLYPNLLLGNKVSHQFKEGNEIRMLDHIPRFHNQRDIEIFKLLARDIEVGDNRFVTTKALQKLYEESTGKSSSVHKYHVLRRDLPSNTIPAHLYKDGLRHIHPDSKQARSITVREAARLQSFPDDFEFLGSMGAKYKMIGNAVPPEFAKKIALALHETLIGN